MMMTKSQEVLLQKRLQTFDLVHDLATRGLFDYAAVLCAACLEATPHNIWSYNETIVLC